MKTPVVFWLLMPMNVFHLWILLSGLVIEKGAYMRELDAYGVLIGSTAYYGLYVIMFNLIVAIAAGPIIESYRGRFQPSRKKAKVGIIAFAILATILAGYALYIGSPILTGVDRFTFLESVGFLAKKTYLLHFSAGFFCGMAARQNGTRLLAIATLLLWFVAVVAMGDKFSALLMTTLAFVSGYKAIEKLMFRAKSNRRPDFGSIVRSSVLLGLLASILCGVPVFGYLRYHGVKIEDMAENIYQRIAIDQGAVWHGTFKAVQRDGARLTNDHIWGADSLEHPSGINALMFVLADYSFAMNSREAGISFAMGYPAIIIAVHGLHIGFLISLLSAVAVALCLLATFIWIKRDEPLWIFLGLNAWYILQDIFLMGRTWKLAGWQFAPVIIVILVAALLELCRQNQSRRLAPTYLKSA